MTAIVTQRVHRLADSLAELKVKVRAALATELAGAVGGAVRDVLVVALIDRILIPRTRTAAPSPHAGGWREDGYEDRDRWGEPKDPWADPDDYDTRARTPTRYERGDRDEPAPASEASAVPTAAALAVGVNVARWWLARRGTPTAAIGFGVLATLLGLAGGPVARAALAVLAAATDILTAESALARIDPS